MNVIKRPKNALLIFQKVKNITKLNKYTAMCWSARKLLQKQWIRLNYELCLKYIDSSLSKVEAKTSSLKSWKRKNTNMCTFQSVLSFRLTFPKEGLFYNIQIAAHKTSSITSWKRKKKCLPGISWPSLIHIKILQLTIF